LEGDIPLAAKNSAVSMSSEVDENDAHENMAPS
jgi:hypothetical protein